MTRTELAEEIKRLCDDLDRAAEAGRDISDQSAAIAYAVAEQHRDAILEALSEPDDAAVERAAKALYEHMYGSQGGKWHAVDPKHLWHDTARKILRAAREG